MPRTRTKSSILFLVAVMAAVAACDGSSTATTTGQQPESTAPTTTVQLPASTTPSTTTTLAMTSTSTSVQLTLGDEPETVEEAFDRLTEMGTTAALAAEVVDGRCEVVASLNSDMPTPLGSVFELYVLAAVGEAVDAGELSWDDEVVISEEMKSIPPGGFQDLPDGTTVTVREATTQMISISDNTATDLLMELIGRESVEMAMVDYGSSTPALNLPFMTTRELAALKVGPASGLRVQWIDGDEAARRAILTQISDITTDDIPMEEWTEPIDPDLVEWFATPNDLCALAIGLDDLAGRVPEVSEMLASTADPLTGTGESVWFKEGSEPGLAASWFVTRSEGRTFVTGGSVVDPDAPIDTGHVLLLFSVAHELLSP